MKKCSGCFKANATGGNALYAPLSQRNLQSLQYLFWHLIQSILSYRKMARNFLFKTLAYLDTGLYLIRCLSLTLISVCLLFQSNKVPVVQHAHHVHPLTPLITYSNEHFSPGTPPSHLSPEILDPKTGKILSFCCRPKIRVQDS